MLLYLAACGGGVRCLGGVLLGAAGFAADMPLVAAGPWRPPGSSSLLTLIFPTVSFSGITSGGRLPRTGGGGAAQRASPNNSAMSRCAAASGASSARRLLRLLRRETL